MERVNKGRGGEERKVEAGRMGVLEGVEKW